MNIRIKKIFFLKKSSYIHPWFTPFITMYFASCSELTKINTRSMSRVGFLDRRNNMQQ